MPRSWGRITRLCWLANAYSVAVGDFNGSGQLDLTTANYGDYRVSMLLGLAKTSAGIFWLIKPVLNTVGLNFINGDEIRPTAIQTYRACRLMVRRPLRNLDLAAIGQVFRDADGAKAVVPQLGAQTCCIDARLQQVSGV